MGPTHLQDEYNSLRTQPQLVDLLPPVPSRRSLATSSDQRVNSVRESTALDVSNITYQGLRAFIHTGPPDVVLRVHHYDSKSMFVWNGNIATSGFSAQTSLRSLPPEEYAKANAKALPGPD